MANLDLLKELLDKETTAEARMEKLVLKKHEFEDMFTAAHVSDFSLGKLELPQISEDSVDLRRSTSRPKFRECLISSVPTRGQT